MAQENVNYGPVIPEQYQNYQEHYEMVGAEEYQQQQQQHQQQQEQQEQQQTHCVKKTVEVLPEGNDLEKFMEGGLTSLKERSSWLLSDKC